MATWLLCRQLRLLGVRVTCFATWVTWEQGRANLDFGVTRPWLTRGCRWDWPGRSLAWRAARRIRSAKPDWVFVVGMTPLARYLLQSNVAAQAVIWELTNATPENKFVDPAARQLLGRCRAVLSPSQTIDQNIRLNHGYKGRILRLPFWIEDKREEQKAESRKQKGHESYLPSPISCLPSPRTAATDFIYLGRRDVEKGLHELVRATAEVSQQFPGVRVLIAGQGSEEPFAAAAHELGVAENIRFQFFRTREETMDALANSRCLVLPSYHEGYPLVLLEAAQASVPFIATGVGSVPELFAGANGCEIIPPRDERALVGAMLRVMGETPETYAGKRTAIHSLFRSLSSPGAVEAALRRVLKDLNGE